MSQSWLFAIGAVLILEGIGPLLFPRQWRQAFEYITRLGDGQIRFFGLVSLLIGLLFLILT